MCEEVLLETYFSKRHLACTAVHKHIHQMLELEPLENMNFSLFRVTRLLNIFNMGKGKKNAGTSQAERAFRSGTCAFAKVWNLLISVPNRFLCA